MDFVVVCLTDSPEREEVHATRRIFARRQDADAYASTVAKDRKPRVIPVTDYLINVEGWRRA